MPVSTSSGKVKFFIGDFGAATTLPVPAEEQENTLTLEFSELISDQLAGWGDTPLVIYVLLDVDFNGNPWYENPEYADFPIAPGEVFSPPTSADITVTPDQPQTPTSEATAVLNYVPLVTDSSGKVLNGTYTVNAKFVFWSQDSGYSSLVTTFSANLSYGNTTPTPTFAYNSSSNTPFLRLTDSEDYTLGANAPTYEGEFILYPPKNKAKITTLTEDVQSIEFSSFWTGGNEFELNVLLEYTYATHDVILFKQAYEDFTIYKIDSCSIFNCLNSLYEKYKNTKCGTKMYAITQERMLEANSLALQLYSGQGCSEESLTDVLEDFEALCGCDCECLSDEVTQIGATNVVSDNDIQFVNATTSETIIDLSEGSTVFVSLAVGGGTTEIQATNITQYATYRFIFNRSFSTQEATFETELFADGNGDVAPATPTFGNRVALEFFARNSSSLVMTSRNDDLVGDLVESVVAGDGIDVDSTDTQNPVVSLDSATEASLLLADSSLQPGDNVSELVNDADYIPVGGNVSDLVNDSDYTFSTPQTVVVTTSSVNVDLSQGNLIYLELNMDPTIETELSVSNIVANTNYRFAIKSTFSNIPPGPDDNRVAFDPAVFFGSDGSLPVLTPTGSRTTVLDFVSPTSSTLILASRSDTDSDAIESVGAGTGIDIDDTDPAAPIVSLDSGSVASLGLADSALQSGDNVSELTNDAGYAVASYQAISGVSGAQEIDFSGGVNVSILTSADLTLTANNYVAGGSYKIVVYNTSVSARDVTFSTDDFIFTPFTYNLSSNGSVGFDLIAVDFGLAGVFLIPVSQYVTP